jgi:(p)ppGpp synthase/HD superfamily hydrolase
MNHPGYSDRVNHALAFAAKYYTPPSRRGSGLTYLTHPANVAVILARYGCHEITVVAGILGYLMDEAGASYREPLERKIGEKFGAEVATVVKDVLEPRYDARGKERTWEATKMDYLANLATAEPRALEICAANQIHLCGSMLADVRRLGIEYLGTYSRASAKQTLWWYQAVARALEGDEALARRGMVGELRNLTAQLEEEFTRES